MSKVNRTNRRGVTLAEMLVAVGITIMMLLATSVVFTSSGKASGKATAYSDIMQQARALCRQLEQDFGHLRPDMPLAILFETANPLDPTSVRMDRIVFFANGDFQTLDGGYSGNLARIFYGQARDLLPTPAQIDNPSAPYRRILTRRQKILSPLPVGNPPVNSDTWPIWNGLTLPEEYDYIPVENSTESYWKSENATNWTAYHFRTWDGTTPPSPPITTEWKCSMVRRPDVAAIQAAIDMGTLGQDALQKLYVLPDVSEFKIDVWYAAENRWAISPVNNAYYWNIADPSIGNPEQIDFPFTLNYLGNPSAYGWFSEDDLFNLWTIPRGVPKALRFTFTIHDKDRRHFPEGKTFTYIVELPKRE